VPWQARLSATFSGIKFTVCPKADSLFKIVGAASIIAKVTRDRYIENWRDPEDIHSADGKGAAGKRKREEGDQGKREGVEPEGEVIRGSGYPSDPRTQAFLKEGLHPVFGYKGIVRFSWATVKVILEKQGVDCKWYVPLPRHGSCSRTKDVVQYTWD
jgi:ribonuclease H2 subunit A